jgi:hypothetical protein
MNFELSLFDRIDGYTTAFVAVMFPIFTVAMLMF